jgi:hypothetical protein
MIELLKNPKSPLYFQLKNYLLSADFPWFFNSSITSKTVDTGEYQDVPFYGHVFMSRPRWGNNTDKLYPEVRSMFMDKFYPLLEEIIDYNQLNVNYFLRFNANCVHPSTDNRLSIPHNDHQFPTKNLLIYFTDAAGETILLDDNEQYVHHPEEDEVITFEGLHCMRPPKEKRRIVLVATYL